MVDEQRQKRQKKSNIPKRRESEDKGAVAIVKSVLQLGCVLQYKTRMHSILKERKIFGENPMQKVLNAIERVRFTESTLRHASIREKK